VVGHDVGGYRPGDRLRVIGRYETHATYGEQFRVRHAVRLDTPDADGILALCQLCPHIGEARARALLDELGIDEFLDAVDDDPQAVFGALPGMNPERAHAAARAWEGLRGQRDLIATLAPLGLAHLAPQVTRWFTDRATEVIHDAPYELIRVPGFGFERADAVANRVGITDPGARARAAVLHLLEEAEKRGETFLPRELLGRKLHTLLGDEANLEAGLSEPTLILEGDAVYRRHTHRAERQVAGDLRELARSKPRLQVGGVPASLGFTDEQQEAVERTFTSRLSVITGGPGVGKTATDALARPRACPSPRNR
jgi:exodeoxyribonuclease V alpha subunit